MAKPHKCSKIMRPPHEPVRSNMRKDTLRSWFFSVLLALGGVALAAVAAQYHSNYEQSRQEAQFKHEGDMVLNAIRQQVQAGAQLVRAMQASFLVSENLSQEDFVSLYESLNPNAIFPGLQAILYSKREPDGQSGDHYWTLFVAPEKGNEILLGFDLAQQPKNIAAVKLSERTGQPAISEPFHLIQDGTRVAQEKPMGVTIRIPVYAAKSKKNDATNIVGSIGISFRINDLIGSALPSRSNSGVAVAVSDVTNGKKLIYSMGKPSEEGLSMTESFEIGGRVWQVKLSPVATAIPGSSGPIITFLSISTLGLLLSFMVFNLLKARARAVNMATEMGARFRQSEERFRLLNENLPGMVVLSDGEGVISYVNKSCRTRMEIVKSSEKTVMDLFRVPALIERLNALPEGVEHLHMPRVQLADRFGRNFWASLSFSRMNINGCSHIMALGSDVSEIIDMAQQLDLQAKQLHFQASHDQLTGLVNRREFEEKLGTAITDASRGLVSSLMYIDLDQFKVINDTAGHMAGDKLLTQASEGMRGLMSEDDLLARMGGDEFAILSRSATQEKTENLAEQVRKFFEEFSFAWDGIHHKVSASIGMVLINQDVTTPEDALSRADAACYLAKERGRNRWQFFDEGSESAARRVEMEWVARIRHAMSENRMELHYQDIVPVGPDARQGAHFEILVRMKDETGILIPAYEFIPAAERYGLMPLIDRWVITTALENFQHLHPNKEIELCAINLSGETVDDQKFEEFLIKLLNDNPAAASKICIEITETAAIRNMNRLQEFIPRLRATGCKLALDDFGAGMSSLGYLKKLKVDLVKIDGSFIRDLDHDDMSQSIVAAVTEISHKIGMEVVAEWVGSQAILNILNHMGVDYAQGFYLHQPTPCHFLAKMEG